MTHRPLASATLTWCLCIARADSGELPTHHFPSPAGWTGFPSAQGVWRGPWGRGRGWSVRTWTVMGAGVHRPCVCPLAFGNFHRKQWEKASALICRVEKREFGYGHPWERDGMSGTLEPSGHLRRDRDKAVGPECGVAEDTAQGPPAGSPAVQGVRAPGGGRGRGPEAPASQHFPAAGQPLGPARPEVSPRSCSPPGRGRWSWGAGPGHAGVQGMGVDCRNTQPDTLSELNATWLSAAAPRGVTRGRAQAAGHALSPAPPVPRPSRGEAGRARGGRECPTLGARPSSGRCRGHPAGQVWPLTSWAVPLVGTRGQERGQSVCRGKHLNRPPNGHELQRVGEPGPPGPEPSPRLGSGPCRGGTGAGGPTAAWPAVPAPRHCQCGRGPHTPTWPPPHRLACVGAPGRGSAPTDSQL